MDQQRSSEGSRRRRRRANAADQAPRERVRKVTLSEAELARLQAKADAEGVSVPRLMVESALAGGRETVTERRRLMTELMAAHRTLAGAAVNMNQVARKANTVHEVPADFEAVFKDLRRLGAKLEAVVDQLVESNRRDGIEVPAR